MKVEFSGQCYSYYTLGYLYLNRSEFSQALQAMEESLRFVGPSGFAVPLVDSNASIGLIFDYLGDYERGKSYALSALQNARDHLPALEIGPIAILAVLEIWYWDLNAMEDWLGDSEPAPGILSYSGFERIVAECIRLSVKREYERLVNISTEYLDRFRPYGNLVFLSEILRHTGDALLALDRIDEARQYLEEARGLAQHAPHQQIEIFMALSGLEAKLGNDKAVRAHQAAARRSLELVLQRIGDPQLEASFLARPAIKAVRDD